MVKIKAQKKKLCPVCHHDFVPSEDLNNIANFKCGSSYVLDKFLNEIFEIITPCPNLDKIALVKENLFQVKTANDWQLTFPCVKVLRPDGWGKLNVEKQWGEDLITLSQYYRKIIQSDCYVEKNNWVIIYERIL